MTTDLTRRGFVRLGAAGACGLALAQRVAAPQTLDSIPIQRHQPEGACRRARMDPGGVDRIVNTFRSMLASRDWHGGQLAVYRNGEMVVELAGGTGVNDTPVKLDSLLCILSTTKALTAMAMHTLHDRGLFSYDDRVAKHWPEFAQNGKEDITIRQVMSHRAGLVESNPLAGLIQWQRWTSREAVARIIEGKTPAWDPGTANGYHALSFGQVCDELVQRWTDKDTGNWLRAEICKPLAVDDVYIGLPDEQFARFVGFKPLTVRAQQPVPGYTPPPGGEGHFFNSPAILGKCLAWGSGVARARDLARLLNVYAYEGSWGGERFFSVETFTEVVKPNNAPDVVDRGLGARALWGLGLLVGTTEGTARTEGPLYGTTATARSCGHLGGNTSLGWADPDYRLAVSFISTGTTGTVSYAPLSDAIRTACIQ
jgi:CubicO group peptidase (beta-lactamase class C family)